MQDTSQTIPNGPTTDSGVSAELSAQKGSVKSLAGNQSAPSNTLLPTQSVTRAQNGIFEEDRANIVPYHSGSGDKVNGVLGNHAPTNSRTVTISPPPPQVSPGLPEVPRIDVQVARADKQGLLQAEADEQRDSEIAESATHTQHPSIADHARQPDSLSSPGSTAQSTLTPAVHDASANTSPDSDAPQELDQGEGTLRAKPHEGLRGEEGEVDGAAYAIPSVDAPVSDASLPTPTSGVEAQLLQESAAAQLNQLADSTTAAATPHLLSQGTRQKPTDTAQGSALGLGDSEEQRSDPAVAQVVRSHSNRLQPGGSIGHSEAAGDTKPEDQVKWDEGAVTHMDIDKADGVAADSQYRANASSVQECRAEGQGISVSSDSANASAPDTDKSISEPPPGPSAISAGLLRQVSADANISCTARDKATTGQASSQLVLHTSRTRDRRRRSTPTVIFGKQPRRSKPSDDGAVIVSQQAGQIPTDDYFTPLFIEGFTRQSTWMKPIEKLINQAHKTLSTSDQYISMLDHQACKILRRVYHLQQHDKWSLRQPVRCPEPTRPASHWDVLLQEMKWMRTDFREERKWKRAVARNLAHACAEWVHSDPATRLLLQVNAVIPPRSAAVGSTGAKAERSEVEDGLPDLIHTDSPTNDEDELPEIVDCVAPSAIFALPDDEVVFGLQPSKTAELLLQNLPLHGSPLMVPKFDVSDTNYDPDAKWKRPAVPLSKYVEGEMVLASKGPPRKRRRYDYLAEEEDDEDDEIIFGDQTDNGANLQAENSSVALFSPEMKGIRDRLHAGHQFRPPTEHPMPPQSFFESRTASQWTWAEDEQLKSLVRECSYNWSLISAMVSTSSMFASGAERRTPWECFERWVSLGSLDGLPNDMARTPYFKAYQARIDAAQRAIAQQNQSAQQQVGPNGAVTPIPRRRPTTSFRVERRRNQKHLALIDAMRKLAKKREATAQKAQQAANLAAMRKANEVPRQQIQNKTPRDYSIMRWERDQALAERMAAYAIRQADANARRLVSATSTVRLGKGCSQLTLHDLSRSRTYLVKCRVHQVLFQVPRLLPRLLQQIRLTMPLASTSPDSLALLDRPARPGGYRCQQLQEQYLQQYKHVSPPVALCRRFRWRLCSRLNFKRCKLLKDCLW